VQLSQSDNLIAQAEATYQAEVLNLMMKTTEAYFNVLSALDNLEFAMAEKTHRPATGTGETAIEVGIIAITDVNEAQAAFDQSNAGEIERQPGG